MFWESSHHPEYLQARHVRPGAKYSPDREWAEQRIWQQLNGTVSTAEGSASVPAAALPATPELSVSSQQPADVEQELAFARPDTDRLRDEWPWAANQSSLSNLMCRLNTTPRRRFRIAIAGVSLEANRFAPITERADFHR